MKDLTDFAVLCKGVTIPSKDDTLRVIPLASAPSVSDALKGIPQGTAGSLVPNDIDKNMPKNEAGAFIDNVVKVQHKSDGYCRIVAKLTNNTSAEVDGVVASAKGFILIQKDEKDTWKPIAVASLNAGIDLNPPEIYVAFTFSKTNNYQSVSFSPNAFATIEDINEINGLDGLHIAFDHASGDIKLLDGEGNVLDQANLHMDADTIIADGEEGYKYVKTDRQQDIHAAKAWMPAGKTAGASVDAVEYSVQKACFLVNVTDEQTAVNDAQATVKTAQDNVTTAQDNVDRAQTAVDTAQADFDSAQVASDQQPDDQTLKDALANAASALSAAQDNLGKAQSDLSEAQATLKAKQTVLSTAQATLADLLSSKAVREGTSPAICGIRACGASDSTHKDYIIGGSYNNSTIGATNKPFLVEGTLDVTYSKYVYSPEAFVWTVGSDVGEEPKEGAEDNRTFAQKMNANAQALGFHVGDDIPLGTNIPALLTAMADIDAEAYMHEGTDSDYIDELVDAQRNLAKDELVAWNAQHPALVHDGLSGTRISSDGVDIRNGKIEIGNGIGNKDENEDNVKRYVIETNLDYGPSADTGLQIGVIGSLGSELMQRDILTINAEGYISGAPTCLALLKCSKVASDGTVSASLGGGGRITANFDASGAEADGVFTLTITDNRANNGFGYAPRIVEIIPVYKSGADATEAVPAQRSISAIKEPNKETGGKTLSIKCSQVIDWAQSIDLGGTENGMELYLIVKVY